MPVVVQEIPTIQVVERIQEQFVEPVEMPLQEHVQLHTAIQIVHVRVPQFENSTSISSAQSSAALAPGAEYNAPTQARADFDKWIAQKTLEGETPMERITLRRHAQESSAERAAAELLKEEEMAAPKTKKAKKGKR